MRTLNEVETDILEAESRLRVLRRERGEFLTGTPAAQADSYRHTRLLKTLPKILSEVGIDLPRQKLSMSPEWWRLETPIIGEVNGIPSLRGMLVCTNGIMAILVKPNRTWFDVHIKDFLVDQDSNNLEWRILKSDERNKSVVKKRQESLERALAKYK